MSTPDRNEPTISRRGLLGGAAAMATSMSMLGGLNVLAADTPKPATTQRKIKLGLVGCGGRGHWLLPLFMEHGGYELHALADYFPEVAEAAGDKFGVAKTRRFSGLSGYKKLTGSGVEAVLIEDVPYFYPEQAKAAVEAGLHVYMAKPIAVDVPGCLTIEAAAKQATQKQRCFLVDYQLPHDPACIEVADPRARRRAGKTGPRRLLRHRLAGMARSGVGQEHRKPAPRRNLALRHGIERRHDRLLRHPHHRRHRVDLGPTARSAPADVRAICRPEPHGDRTDAAAVIYEMADGTIWTHVTQSINNNIDITTLSASICGMQATAHLAVRRQELRPRRHKTLLGRKQRHLQGGRRQEHCRILPEHRGRAL